MGCKKQMGFLTSRTENSREEMDEVNQTNIDSERHACAHTQSRNHRHTCCPQALSAQVLVLAGSPAQCPQAELASLRCISPTIALLMWHAIDYLLVCVPPQSVNCLKAGTLALLCISV